MLVGWEDELLPWHTVLEVRRRHLTELSMSTFCTGKGNQGNDCWHLVQRSLTNRPGHKLPSHIAPRLELSWCLASTRCDPGLSHSGCTSWWPRSRVWRAGRAATAEASTSWCKGRRSPCCRGPGPRCSRCLRWRRSSRPRSLHCTGTHRILVQQPYFEKFALLKE